MTLTSRLLWQSLDRHFLQIAEDADENLLVISPFIKRRIFDRLLDVVKRRVQIKVYTRWLPSEVALGVSDPQIFLTAKESGKAAIHLIDELHAKLIIADEKTLLLGSANFTAAAWGLKKLSNFETATIFSPVPEELTLFLMDLNSRSRPATEEEMKKILAEANDLKQEINLKKLEPEPDPDSIDGIENKALPLSRSPDRLYRQYTALRDSAKPDSDALHDLLMIDCGPSLDEGEFNLAAASFLRSHPIVRLLDKFLSKPRRFGEIRNWLRDHSFIDDDDQTESKSTQTLIRWLLYFEGDRYQLDTPNYSEILSLRSQI